MAARLCFVIGLTAVTLSLTASASGEEILPPDYDSEAAYGPEGIPMLIPPPHLVLEAPRPVKRHLHGTHETIVYDDRWNASHGPWEASSEPVKHHHKIHDAVASHLLHEDKTPRSIAIPNANRVPVWKTPYSYGHFGASRTRQWTFHNGHQQTYSQWTLR